MATHSRILAWRITWTEEPGGIAHGVSESRTRLSDWAQRSTHPSVESLGQRPAVLNQDQGFPLVLPGRTESVRKRLESPKLSLEGRVEKGTPGPMSPSCWHSISPASCLASVSFEPEDPWLTSRGGKASIVSSRTTLLPRPPSHVRTHSSDCFLPPRGASLPVPIYSLSGFFGWCWGNGGAGSPELSQHGGMNGEQSVLFERSSQLICVILVIFLLVCVLNPWYSKCGSFASLLSITWELVRNGASPCPPQTSQIRGCILTRSPGDWSAH